MGSLLPLALSWMLMCVSCTPLQLNDGGQQRPGTGPHCAYEAPPCSGISRATAAAGGQCCCRPHAGQDAAGNAHEA